MDHAFEYFTGLVARLLKLLGCRCMNLIDGAMCWDILKWSHYGILCAPFDEYDKWLQCMVIIWIAIVYVGGLIWLFRGDAFIEWHQTYR